MNALLVETSKAFAHYRIIMIMDSANKAFIASVLQNGEIIEQVSPV